MQKNKKNENHLEIFVFVPGDGHFIFYFFSRERNTFLTSSFLFFFLEIFTNEKNVVYFCVQWFLDPIQDSSGIIPECVIGRRRKTVGRGNRKNVRGRKDTHAQNGRKN